VTLPETSAAPPAVAVAFRRAAAAAGADPAVAAIMREHALTLQFACSDPSFEFALRPDAGPGANPLADVPLAGSATAARGPRPPAGFPPAERPPASNAVPARPATPAGASGPAVLRFELPAAAAHALLLGQLTIPQAAVAGQLQVKGPVAQVRLLAGILPTLGACYGAALAAAASEGATLAEAR
jgi:hypothetical protein